MTRLIFLSWFVFWFLEGGGRLDLFLTLRKFRHTQFNLVVSLNPEGGGETKWRQVYFSRPRKVKIINVCISHHMQSDVPDLQ